MQIVRVTIRDVKGIKYVQLRPKSTTTIIGGRNGQGKSSLLDAVAFALGGRKLCPEKPIRKGQAKGYCEVELDGDPQRLIPPCTVRRDFWLKKDGVSVESKLEVITKEGYRAPSPQTLLGDIVGPLGFDPESFLRMKPAEQATVLKSLVGLDFTDMDREFTELYRERAKVNDAGKRLKVQYEALPYHPEAPATEVSVAALVDELRTRQAVNAGQAKRRKELDKLEATRQEAITRKQIAATQIAELRMKLAALEESHKALDEHVAGLGAQYDVMAVEIAAIVPADTAEVEERIAASEEVNRQVRENDARAEMAARLEAERARSKEMTARLTAIDERKDALRRATQWPVAGLGYDENGVTYQELPFDQIAASEQRRVAVGIACALQPALRFFFLKDGSLLDDESKAEFAQLAAEHGCQCFLEVVGSGSEAHIVIEDGEVARAEEGLLVPEPTPEPAEEPTL